ncbi:unnamed protein product, partial [Effrenium voratum]
RDRGTVGCVSAFLFHYCKGGQFAERSLGNLRLFESLLSFADPELALHLSELGMRPETYAK